MTHQEQTMTAPASFVPPMDWWTPVPVKPERDPAWSRVMSVETIITLESIMNARPPAVRARLLTIMANADTQGVPANIVGSRWRLGGWVTDAGEALITWHPVTKTEDEAPPENEAPSVMARRVAPLGQEEIARRAGNVVGTHLVLLMSDPVLVWRFAQHRIPARSGAVFAVTDDARREGWDALGGKIRSMMRAGAITQTEEEWKRILRMMERAREAAAHYDKASEILEHLVGSMATSPLQSYIHRQAKNDREGERQTTVTRNMPGVR